MERWDVEFKFPPTGASPVEVPSHEPQPAHVIYQPKGGQFSPASLHDLQALDGEISLLDHSTAGWGGRRANLRLAAFDFVSLVVGCDFFIPRTGI